MITSLETRTYSVSPTESNSVRAFLVMANYALDLPEFPDVKRFLLPGAGGYLFDPLRAGQHQLLDRQVAVDLES